MVKNVLKNKCKKLKWTIFGFLQMIDFDFCDFGGSGIFQLIPGSSNYHALLSAYGNLICANPGGCVKIVNCNEKATA